jgi:hypothetical protein
MSMRQSTAVLSVVILVVTGVLSVASPASGGSAGPWDTVEVEAEEFVVSVARAHRGEPRWFRTGDDAAVVLRSTEDPRWLDVQVRPAGEPWFSISIAAPEGQELAAGRFDDATTRPAGEKASIDVGYQGEGCSTPGTGGFEVHRIEPDLSVVWFSWWHHCYLGSGEVRVGLPEPSEAVQLSPRQAEWTVRRVGTTTTLPVLVRNTSRAVSGVRDVRVTGGASHWRAEAGEGCRRLEPDAECAVAVRYRPTGSKDGRRSGRLRLTMDDGSRHRVELRGGAQAGVWRLSARAEDGRRVSAGPTTVSVTGARGVGPSGPGEEVRAWNEVDGESRLFLTLRAPRGEVFQVGRTYDGYRLSSPSSTRAYMGLSLGADGCDGAGTFRFHELTHRDLPSLDDVDEVDRVALTFDWACPPGSPSPGVRGTVAAHVDAAPPEAGPRGAVTLRRAGPRGGGEDQVTVRPRTRAMMLARVAPAGRGGCVQLVTERRVGPRWRPEGRTACTPTRGRSAVTLAARTAHLPVRTRARARAVWRTGPTPLGRELLPTRWHYLKIQ